MADLVVVGRGETYVRLRMEGLQNPMSSYANVRINNDTLGTGSANLNSGGGQASDGTYYSDTWTSSSLTPSTSYDFSASVTTSFTTYWYYQKGVTTLESTDPPPAPSAPNLSGYATTVNNIYTYWTNTASNYTLQWRVSGSGATYSSYNTTGTDYTITGLQEGTEYEIRVQAYDCNAYGCSYSTWDYLYEPTMSDRPADWSWYTSKTSGTAFNCTATEWNDFCSRINEFRIYKGLSSYSFTSAEKGKTAYHSQVNQAITAITDMNPPTSVPSSVSSGGDCLAYTLNRLRDSLNSIT